MKKCSALFLCLIFALLAAPAQATDVPNTEIQHVIKAAETYDTQRFDLESNTIAQVSWDYKPKGKVEPFFKVHIFDRNKQIGDTYHAVNIIDYGMNYLGDEDSVSFISYTTDKSGRLVVLSSKTYKFKELTRYTRFMIESKYLQFILDAPERIQDESLGMTEEEKAQRKKVEQRILNVLED